MLGRLFVFAFFGYIRYNISTYIQKQRRKRGINLANKVVIMLGGVRYPLRTVEEPSYVSALADEMDIALRKVMGENSLTLSESLVLLGLEYLDGYKKAERNLDNMRNQVAEYMETVKRSKRELEQAKEEIRRLKAKSSD